MLIKRAGDLGWQYRRLEAAPRTEDFVAMRVNALVVDLTLLGPGAWEFLERVAETLPGLGIVVCTGRSSVSQRVRGLRMGADDWVTKPCHPEEVLARVEAVVRRRKRASARVDTGPLVAGDLEIRADQFQAFVRGSSIDLTRREFEVLQLLAQAKGKVLQREEIYQAVWGYAMAHGDRSVDVFIRKVRQKLEQASPDCELHPHPLRRGLPLRARGALARRQPPEGSPRTGCPWSPTPSCWPARASSYAAATAGRARMPLCSSRHGAVVTSRPATARGTPASSSTRRASRQRGRPGGPVSVGGDHVHQSLADQLASPPRRPRRRDRRSATGR